MTEDQIAKKCIDDNFRGWSHESIYIRLHDNMTLFDRVKRDKQNPKIVFGARYYATLRDCYRSPEDVMSALKARDPSEDRMSGRRSFSGARWD